MQPATRELILAFVAGIVVLFLMAGYIIYFLFLYQKKQARNIVEKRERELYFQEQLLRSQLEIKEQTIQHVAHELHDNLGQIASLIKINLHTLKLTDRTKAEQQVEELKDLTRQLLADLKALALNMDGSRVVHFGLEKVLENDIDRLNKTGRLQATLTVEGNTPTLDGSRATILYRMLQEILNNAVKHSNATTIAVSLKTSENLFILVCRDDGVGFDVYDQVEGGGLGLINLHSRAKLINGILSIHSERKKGTVVTIQLPV